MQRFAYREEIEFPEHSHDELSIVVCTSGMIESSQFGMRETMRPGDVLVTNRMVRHGSRYLCEKNCVASGITIELSLEMQRRLGVFGSLYLGRLRLERVEQIVNDLERELLEQRAHTEIMRVVLAQELLVRVMREWPVDLVRPGTVEEAVLLTRREFVETAAALQRGQWEDEWEEVEFLHRFENTTGLKPRALARTGSERFSLTNPNATHLSLR